jgi:hypothetical protein
VHPVNSLISCCLKMHFIIILRLCQDL